METQPHFVARAQYARVATANHAAIFSRNLRYSLLMALLAIMSWGRAFAQSYETFDLSTYVHGVSSSDGPWNTGDTVTVSMSLGDANAPANYFVGIQVQFALGAATAIPNPLPVSVAGSWAFDPANWTHTVDLSMAPQKLGLHVHSADSSWQSGAGLLFSFQLIATADNVYLGDLVAVDGGIVIVENVDARLAAPAPAPNTAAPDRPALAAAPMLAYPNPAQRQACLPLPMQPDLHARLLTASGQHIPLRTVSSVADGEACFDLDAIPSGVYLLQLLRGSDIVAQSRLVKRE